MKKTNPDQLFSQLLQADQVGKPDRSIEDRLMYTYMLKSGHSKLRQNSFSSFFGWILSAQSLGLKAGLVSLVLFFSVINNHLSLDPGTITGCDTLTSQRVLVADTTNFIQNLDSIRTDSLN
ncbi:MAG TPA: hypothetical protein VGK10_14535 [Prolixibacteraceae bacterium]|jgi:hypothetical protein